MKKILSILLCIMICSAFSSCTKPQGNRINKLQHISSRDERIANADTWLITENALRAELGYGRRVKY